MMNKLLMGAAALALLGALGHFGAKPLLAQIRAALIKNIDEPGRTPYQSSQSCNTPGNTLCSADFTPVPAGKRLVIQHLSGLVACYSINNNCELQFNYVFLTTKGPNYLSGGDSAYVPMQTSANSQTAINQDVRLYVEPGGVPEYQMVFNSGPVFAYVTITGYLVDLNQ
jgi:hypothetical protein